MVNRQQEGFSIPSARPVVIIGMHRSGTSFLAQALAECGLFMGADAQGNHESMLFLSTNDDLFFRCYSTWNSPFGIHLALQDENTTDRLARVAFETLGSNIDRYLGADSPGGIQKLGDEHFHWGWKDPRTTFTLPVWNRIFPEIRIIHMLRHGVDVANSLFRRDWAQYHQHKTVYVSALAVKRDALGLHHGRRGWTLEQAFTLWEEYAEKAAQQMDGNNGNILQVKYEELLQDPKTSLERILAFCGLADISIPSGLLASVDSTRAFVYKSDPELVGLAIRRQETLARFGY